MMPIRMDEKPKRSKYGVRTDEVGKAQRTVDGVLFDSLKEAQYYEELKLRRKLSEVHSIQLQPIFKLTTGGVTIGKYRGDFSYVDAKTHRKVIVDCKGMKTALYRWKKKHVEAEYGITIVEV